MNKYDHAMEQFMKDHHIWEVFRYLFEVIHIQNRENRKLGEYVNHLHGVVEELKGDIDPLSGRSLELDIKPYFFKIEPRELDVMRKSRNIFDDFMKIDKKLPRE